MMKAIFTGIVLVTSASSIYAQDPGTKPPIVQLVEDLEAGAARANLSDSQKSHLESDKAVLRAAREARQQGQSVDRRKVQSAIQDIQTIVHSGAFQAQDQQRIDGDVATLRAARGR